MCGAQCLYKQRLAIAEIVSKGACRHPSRCSHSPKRRGAKAFLGNDIPACHYEAGSPVLMIYNFGHTITS
jgi:hypothetical protein